MTPTFHWPLPQRAVSSGFTDLRSYGIHAAIDIPAPLHTPIHPIASGRIAYAGPFGDCGLTVQIDHAEGWRSHYCHLNSVRHPTGTYIQPQGTLGDVGLTGVTLGPHLHLNLFSPTEPAQGSFKYVAWVGKWAVNPLRYLTETTPAPEPPVVAPTPAPTPTPPAPHPEEDDMPKLAFIKVKGTNTVYLVQNDRLVHAVNPTHWRLMRGADSDFVEVAPTDAILDIPAFFPLGVPKELRAP